MIYIFLLLILCCSKSNNLTIKNKIVTYEIVSLNGEKFKEEFKKELFVIEKDIEKRDFIFTLLKEMDKKDRDEKNSQILLVIAEENIDNFSLNKENELRYGGEVFSKMVSYGEQFDELAKKIIGNCRENIILFGKLMNYLKNKNYKTKVYSLYNKYVAERIFIEVGLTIDGCKRHYSSKKEELDKRSISIVDFEQSLEKMLYCILISNKTDFRFDFMDWLIDNQKNTNYRRLMIDPINSSDLLIHSAVRHYDIELFKYLVNKDHKMNFKPEIPFLDPIQLLIVEAGINNNQEKALDFLNKIENIKKINMKKLTKERGYLHFSSYFCLEQLIDFFLKYVDINEYYDASITYTTINKYGDHIWKKDLKDKIVDLYNTLIKYNGADDLMNKANKDKITSTPLSFALGKVSIIISIGALSKGERTILIEDHSSLIEPILNYRCEQNNDKLQKTVRKLVSKGADINIPNKNGVYFFQKIFSNSTSDVLGIMKIIFKETSLNLSMSVKQKIGNPVKISELILSTIKKHKENEELELYTYKDGQKNKFENKIANVITISREKIEYMSPLITYKLLKSDGNLTNIFKDVFNIKGNKQDDFVKLVKMYKAYPNYVSLVVKYPSEFGFDQYNQRSFLDIMSENNCDEHLMSVAKEWGYLNQVEIDEIANNMKKIRKKEISISEQKNPKKKKKNKKRVVEYLSTSEIVEEKVEKDDGYSFDRILSMNDDTLQKEFLELVEQENISKIKQIVTLLSTKGKIFNNINKVVRKALSKSEETFATFLLNKGFGASNSDLLLAISRDKIIFVKRFIEYNQGMNLTIEEKQEAKDIRISKKMQRVLKEYTIYFSFDDEILDSSSEEEDEEVKYMFSKVYVHNSIEEKDVDYIKGVITEGKVVKEKIEDIRLGRKLDVVHVMKGYNFINLRIGNSRVYYSIKDNKMYIVGFNKKKNQDIELTSDLAKYEKRSEDINRDEYTLSIDYDPI